MPGIRDGVITVIEYQQYDRDFGFNPGEDISTVGRCATLLPTPTRKPLCTKVYSTFHPGFCIIQMMYDRVNTLNGGLIL